MSEHDHEERIEQADKEAKAAARRELIEEITKRICDEDDEGLRRLAKD